MNRPSGLKANRPLLFLPAAKTAVWACFYSDIRIQCIVLSIIHADPLRIGIGSIRKEEDIKALDLEY